MKLIERIMLTLKRIRNAMHTKSTHLAVDERVDIAVRDNAAANDRSRRIMMALNETIENMKVERVHSRF